MRISNNIPIAILLFTLASCTNTQTIELFNGKDLNNWSIYIEDENVSPEDVFWVHEGLMHVAGEPKGYIRTKESYNNFKLHVEWRWTDLPKNSGVLIHVQGEDMLWPTSVECQLKHQNAGDIVLMGPGTGISIRDSSYIINEGDKRLLVIQKSEESSELEPGEWNEYDIVTYDDNIEVTVNGVLQNVGSGMTRTEGNILIQSEGAPMQFRNIILTPLD